MIRFSLTILLVLILSSCQMPPSPVPVSTSTTEVFPSEIPTFTATTMPTATVIPTPTVIPTATTSPNTLEESAGALCEKSYSAPVVTKEFDVPYLGMSKTERDTVPAWRISNSIPHIFALSEESVHSIICSLETRRQVGIYTDGSAAFQLILNIRVLSWPDGAVVAAKTYESGPPPKTKVGFDGGYGSYPEGMSIKESILNQFEHPAFLYLPNKNIYSAAISPNGRSAALGISTNPSDVNNSYPSRIMLIDLQSLKTSIEWDVPASTLYDLAYSPDGDTIASGGNDSTVYFWNAQSGETLGMTTLPSNPQLIKYSPDGKFIGVMTSSNIYLIDANTMQINTSYPPTGTTFSFSPDSKFIYTNGGGFEITSGNTVFQFFDPAGLSPTIAPDGTVSFDTPDSIEGFTLSPDGTRGVSSSSAPVEDTGITEHVYYLSAWDMDAQERLSRTRFVSNFTFKIMGFSPDGKQLAVNNNGGEIWLLDTGTWQVLRILAGHTNPILELAFSPDSKKIISISSDETARVWSLEN
jgi:WD40 repeat protein